MEINLQVIVSTDPARRGLMFLSFYNNKLQLLEIAANIDEE